MTEQSLTEDQRRMLQRWFDGELDAAERRRAEQLVEDSAAAASYVERLDEVRSAATLAFGEVESAGRERMSADRLVAAAVEAPPIEEEPLEALAPLLERHHDGETTPAEARTVESLREERTDVDDYLEGLDFLGASIRAAEREATEGAELDGIWDGVARSLEVGETADGGGTGVADFDAERHQELIHRYADGELGDEQRGRVEAWLEGSDEARQTLEAIEELGDAARVAEREAAAGVDLDRIAEGVSREIAADGSDGAAPGYVAERDEHLLHRYADGELDEEDRRRVEAWLEADDEARATLEAIRELGEATRSAEREARAGADLDAIWEGVEERLDDASAQSGGDVVSLEAARSDVEARDSGDAEATSGGGGIVGWISEYRQAVGGAAAAAVVLIAAVGLFGPRLFEKERVVVKEKKTVVIVDSVEYSSGSTVAVDGPMKKVRSKPKSKSAPKKQDKPTVIWLLDSNGNGSSNGEGGDSSDPAVAPDDEKAPGDEDAGSTDEAGDAATEQPGQPI